MRVYLITIISKNNIKNISLKNVTYLYIYNEILLSHKKEQNNAICSNLDAKWNVRKTNTYDIIYMWNIKYDINKLIYKTETDWPT